MLNLIFTGFFNSNLKLDYDKKYLNIGYLQLYFFINLLKNSFKLNFSNVKIIFKLFKKKKKEICFNKADFKYKISKHLISKFSKNFFLKIIFNSCTKITDL